MILIINTCIFCLVSVHACFCVFVLIFKVSTIVLCISYMHVEIKIMFTSVYMQRIGQSTREGGPSCISLEPFAEALYDPSTELTYPALTGARKQSVSDVERLFSDKMVASMEQKGYHAEAKYIRVVKDWRKACDERGLSDEEREKFNKAFLEYLLDELIPWHKQGDLSQLEVNRYIHVDRCVGGGGGSAISTKQQTHNYTLPAYSTSRRWQSALMGC